MRVVFIICINIIWRNKSVLIYSHRVRLLATVLRSEIWDLRSEISDLRSVFQKDFNFVGILNNSLKLFRKYSTNLFKPRNYNIFSLIILPGVISFSVVETLISEKCNQSFKKTQSQVFTPLSILLILNNYKIITWIIRQYSG